jgi:membrane protease YdiL (CAAX protease family)
MNRSEPSTHKIADAAVVVLICFGWPMWGSVAAVAHRFPAGSFDDSALISLIVFELVLACAALTYLRLRGRDLSPLVPKPTVVGCLVGVALYAVASLGVWPLYWIVGKAELAAQPIEQMIAGASISLPWLLALSIVNGLFEESFLIGYLFRELERFGVSVAIGITILIRALCHVYQGPLGTVSAIGFGLLFALYYWRKRLLWPVVFGHIVADVVGFVLR